jgi:hypothetical protein
MIRVRVSSCKISSWKRHFYTSSESEYDVLIPYWKDVKNQRNFMDQLAIKFEIKNPEEWNRISTKTAVQEGATFIRSYYQGSLWKGNYERL